jgi:hypothetical protein
MLPEPDAATSGRARNSRIDQLDACLLKRGNQLHEGVNVAADDAITGFHALNGRHRKGGQIGHLPLIDVQERASGPELMGGYHERGLSGSRAIYLCRMNYCFKHQFMGTTYQSARGIAAQALRRCSDEDKLRKYFA